MPNVSCQVILPVSIRDGPTSSVKCDVSNVEYTIDEVAPVTCMSVRLGVSPTAREENNNVVFL